MKYSTRAELGKWPDVIVHRANLGPFVKARWCPDQRVLLVNSTMSRIQVRCAVAHELVHMERGDVGQHDDLQARRQEDYADREAARRLIPLLDLADIILNLPEDPVTAAQELGVTAEFLRIRLAHLHPSERRYLRRRLAQRETAA